MQARGNLFQHDIKSYCCVMIANQLIGLPTLKTDYDGEPETKVREEGGFTDRVSAMNVKRSISEALVSKRG